MPANQILVSLVLALALTACGGPGGNADVPAAQPAGESKEQIGDHVVYFNALNTDELSAEVASAYDIVRSRNRVMLNVSVVSADDGRAVAADVSVKTTNLTGQVKNTIMRRIDEQDAIYYIGVTPVANQETLMFNLSIRPEGDETTHQVKFQRQFYTD